MKTLFLSLLLAGSISTVTWAQSAAEANAKYDAKDYKGSGQVYDQVLKNGKGSTADHYNAACSWALAGDKDKAFAHLGKAIDKGYLNISHLKQDSDLNSLHSDKRWEKLVQQLQANVDKAEANYNKPLKAQLEQIYEDDQKYRRMIGKVQQEHGPQSEQFQELIRKMWAADKENLEQIIAIIEEHGWPKKSMVGGAASQAAWAVIQHIGQDQKELMEKYLPMMREAAEKGELQKSSLALTEDRVRMYNNQPQLYGSQLKNNPETNKPEFYPIEDEANVDKRRATIGMEPLSEYAKRFGLEYTPPTSDNK
ncbi:DUF6624 domain-containing protein [Pontibacter lucknowensis]|uniref:Uncharacterized protein n=1 Tax=Pontibacter lucknowensis TaxID=1077936 RepID=A0A1N6TXV1_9BACT|nr:DUF6624 domain-containing protein [Pontibacter lucknowensis]SIQ58205.1 hypothetical protein SAMN05421545_0568 [Pontibacter lucknowensis]